MMSLDELATLPPEIRAISEKPFSATAAIDLRWSTSIAPDGTLQCTHQQVALVAGKSLEILGETFRNPRQPLSNVPLSGYLIGETLLLSPTPVKQLTAPEARVANQFFPENPSIRTDPITGNPADPAIRAVIAGQVFAFGNLASLEHVTEVISNAEKNSETSENRMLNHGLTWLPLAANTGATTGVTLANPFTNDNINVLFIRADFPDLTGEPITKTALEATLADVNSRLQAFSYAKASLNFTVSTAVYRLTTPAATVTTTGGTFGDNDTIITEARAAAAANFTLSNYDVVAVYFPNISALPGSKIIYAGLASLGGANHWINGPSAFARTQVILHEFGHNFGINHANYFHPSRQLAGSYLDPSGNSLETGDIFDRMGGADEISGYFNPYATTRTGWLPASKVIEPTTSGTFRIHRLDHPSATANPTLALRVPMGGSLFHWVSLRQLFPDTSGKAYIINEGLYPGRSNLIDATPASAPTATLDRADAALPVASSFYDPTSGVRFTNLASGGTEPNQFIDVKIDFDARLGLESTSILADEACGHAAISICRSLNPSLPCSVTYSTAAITATPGADYFDSSGTLTWAAGDSSPKIIYIPIRPDAFPEGSETFSLTLSSPTSSVIELTRNIATITILDAGSRVTTFSPPFFNNSVNAIAPLPDGTVIAGGIMNQGIIGNITKLNADGSENSLFRTNKVTGFGNTVNAITRQPDGKLLVGGLFSTYATTSCSRLARLNPDGTLDTAFATALGTGFNGVVHAIALQPDASILVGGEFTQINGTTAQGIAKISPTGTILPFAPAFTFTASLNPRIRAIDVAPDGKIMLVGQFVAGTGIAGVFKFSIARLNPNGSIDPTFDPGFGAHTLDASGQPATANAAVLTSIARVSDAGVLKYIIAGQFGGYNNSTRGSVALLTATGALDPTFSPGTFTGSTTEAFIDSSGRFLLGGAFTAPASRITALTLNGSPDPSINLNGGIPSGFVETFASDANGDTYIGGNFFSFAGATSRPIVKISGGLDRYTLWRNSTFSPSQIASGNTSPTADFDADGILNITEMALGLSPTTADSPDTFTVAAGNVSLQTTASSAFLQATIERSAGNLGVWLIAQFSSDLITWSPALPTPGSNPTYQLIESTSSRFTVRDQSPTSSQPTRFVRFRAILPN